MDENALQVLKIDGRVLDSFVATDTLNSFMMACLVASVTHFLMPPSVSPKTLAGKRRDIFGGKSFVCEGRQETSELLSPGDVGPFCC